MLNPTRWRVIDPERVEQLEDVARVRADRIVRDVALGVAEPGKVGNDHAIGRSQPGHDGLEVALASRASVDEHDRGGVGGTGLFVGDPDAVEPSPCTAESSRRARE